MSTSGRLTVLHPASCDEALVMAAARTGARFVASGTALQLEWARGLAKPKTMIALGRIADLSGVSLDKDGLRIGAGTTLGHLIRDNRLADFPLLAAVLQTVAGPAVRNLATIGGNIAGRTGCLLPALLVMDAVLELHSAQGRRRETLTDWLGRASDPAEIIAAIRLPTMSATDRWTQRKTGLRAAFTPSVIGIAGRLTIDNGVVTTVRLAVGGGIVPPQRITAVEQTLLGQDADGINWRAAHAALLAAIDASDDEFRSGRYRRLVAANALVHGLSGRLPPRTAEPSRKRNATTAPLPEEIRLGRTDQPARWFIRPDLPAKVGGTFAYLTDHRSPDMLVGRILRAGRPHARILSIDTRAAEALPGVVAVVTHRDIAGQNAFGIVIQDQPALCHDKVRYVGDAVAAVAAIDAETAERALALIDVRYEALPVIDSPAAALADSAVSVHAGGNLQSLLQFERGDIATGFAKSAHVVEDTYVTPRQMHGFMETEGGYAHVEKDGSLLVCVGGQHGYRDRLQLSRILAMPEANIRVVTSPTGGAFGGKDELTVQPALALLALKSGQPVRLQLSRAESVIAGTKRNPMVIRMRTACDVDGLLLAQEVDVLADAGAYASLGPGVLETALEHAVGPYVVPHVRTRGRLAYTNNGICGAFRGFGANQMTFAIECQMDRLAQRCGLTPIEIRRRNMRVAGTRGYLGQQVAPSERLTEMLQAAQADPIWQKPCGPSADGTEIIGIGMAINYQGNGLGSLVPDPAGGRLSFTAEGRIAAGYSLDEMGQGLLPIIQTAVAAELGCGREDIVPRIGDTAASPDSGSTTASRGTYVVWAVARQAAPEFSEQLRIAAGRLLGRDPQDLRLTEGGLADRLSNSGDLLIGYPELAARLTPAQRPDVSVSFAFPKNDHQAGNARYIFAFGACLARVAVDRISGQVRVLDLVQHTAAGPVLDIAAYLGQIEGGAVQGLGFSVSEDATMLDGHYRTGNFDSYMMPGIADSPLTIAVHALEGLDAGDPHGPRGGGELGIGAVTPAIANAVADAIGFCPAVTPFSAETMLDAMAATA